MYAKRCHGRAFRRSPGRSTAKRRLLRAGVRTVITLVAVATRTDYIRRRAITSMRSRKSGAQRRSTTPSRAASPTSSRATRGVPVGDCAECRGWPRRLASAFCVARKVPICVQHPAQALTGLTGGWPR
jgi:hypothetical protein